MDEDFLLSLAPEEEQLRPAFSDLGFINAFGGTVPEDKVLDYFERSPFYDKSCNNKSMSTTSHLVFY